MTYISSPTKEGETLECPNCKDTLIARLKEYKDFPNKIQWQDKDHAKAHFDKDGNCKGMQPHDDEAQEVHNTSDGPHEPKVSTFPEELPQIDEVTLKYVDNNIQLIRQIEKRVFEKLGADANVAKVGMYVKLILEGINQK